MFGLNTARGLGLFAALVSLAASPAFAQTPNLSPVFEPHCTDCSGTEYFGLLTPGATNGCQNYQASLFENWTAEGQASPDSKFVAAAQTDIIEVNQSSDADFWYYQVVTRGTSWSSVLLQSVNLEMAFGDCSNADTRFRLLLAYSVTSSDVTATWNSQGNAQVKFYRDSSTLNARIGGSRNDGPAAPGGDTSNVGSDNGYDTDVTVSANDARTRLRVVGGNTVVEFAIRRSTAALLAVANPFTPCFGRVWTGQTSTISKDQFAINDHRQTSDFNSTSWAIDSCNQAVATSPCDPAPDCTGSDTACGVASCDEDGLPGNCDILSPRPAGTECRADTGDCDVAETCDGANTGACPADAFEPPLTACGSDSDTDCDNPDSCDGNGTCLANNEPGTIECRPADGECDVAENCDGAGNCPVDGFASAGTNCGDASSSLCDNPDSCDGNGTCLANNEPGTTECRGADGDCDVAENCDGAGNCPVDTFAPVDTACGDSADTICDKADSCDGSGTCLPNHEPATVECRADGGECDVAENCDGAGNCPADGFEPADTACGDSADTICDNADSCDGSGVCQPNHEPASVECRADAGACDVAETCDGAGACPADAFEPAETSCGNPGETICDGADSCDGSGNCLTNNEPVTTECRAAVGDCDAPESCDGAGSCPDDSFEPADTACGDPAESICDNADSCDGNGACLPNHEPATVECRAATGECDVAENCDGAGSCPADAFEPAETLCRALAGGCDAAETCDGVSPQCPPDEVQPADTECRPTAGICDIAESCDGLDASCPADAFETSDFECRGAGGVCDEAESCTGTDAACPADAFVSPSTVCRASAAPCDSAETCTGSQSDCPADAAAPNGSPCDDANACTTGDSCAAGVCTPGQPLDCNDNDLCTVDSCDALSGCSNEAYLREPETCFNSAAGRLTVVDRTFARKDAVRWAWRKGESFPPEDMGSPSTTGYALCIFDQSSGDAVLASSLEIPPGAPYWKSPKPGKQRYIDRPGTFDGIRRVRTVTKSTPLRSKLVLTARGVGVPLPVPATASQMLLMDPTVVVQFVNSEDECWSTEFTPGDTVKNSALKYRARFR